MQKFCQILWGWPSLKEIKILWTLLRWNVLDEWCYIHKSFYIVVVASFCSCTKPITTTIQYFTLPMSSCRFCQNPAECQYSIQNPQEWYESNIPVYSKWNSYGLIGVNSEWNFIILTDSHGIPIESIPLLQIQGVKYQWKLKRHSKYGDRITYIN